MTLPNALSAFRIVLALAVAAGLADMLLGSGDGGPLAIVAFTLGVLTDVLDGAIARRTHQTSVLGARLDPIADKALVYGTLWPLARTPAGVALLSVLAARDLAVTVLRSRDLARAQPDLLAKLKTALLYLACAALLVRWTTSWLGGVGESLLVAGVLASLVAAARYVRLTAAQRA